MSYTRSVKVVGLYLLRNEADIIETNLRHHFAVLIDEAIVVDNGSTDGTMELLVDLADDLPLQLASEVGHMYQAERVTRMARFATLQGADWVIPIDADEFWVGTDTPPRDVLEEAPSDVLALFVEVVNFVQSRDIRVAEPGCVASMTMRPQQAVAPSGDIPRMVRDGELGYVEIGYTPKCVRRARPDITVSKGNHFDGDRGGMPTDRITCLHAPVRAFSKLTSKLDHGRRALEEGVPGETSWQTKRWWQMARERTLDREWEALSYADGAITVAGRRRELVRDDRLRDAVTAVAPLVRTTADDIFNPTNGMPPAVGAYLLALDTVPGWFSALDLRVLVELDRLQGRGGVSGDVFEIGTYLGKSAILLGHLARAPGERLTVCDVFEHADLIDPESYPVHHHWYSELTEKAFVEQYLRFHADLPEIIVGAWEAIPTERLGGTCPMVHVDGGDKYDVVRQDASTARLLLRPGGIVAFDDISTLHNPGSALAAWELRLFALDRPQVDADKLVRIPDLEELPGGASAGEQAGPTP